MEILHHPLSVDEDGTLVACWVKAKVGSQHAKGSTD
jgi:hypothetical protein